MTNDSTFVWLIILGVLDVIGLLAIMRYGTAHPDPTPEKPQDSPAVLLLQQYNAERLAKVEAGRAKALTSGEAVSS